MKILRRVGIVLLVLVVVGSAWIWWNRPGHTDLATYVPADALVYLEADSLPSIAGAVTKTEAWQALAPAAGIRAGASESGLLGKLMAWTGIGPAESVVLSRVQLAVVVLGFDAADGGEALRIKPKYALLAETHSSESRTLAAVESQIGKFATRAYVTPTVDRKVVEGVQWLTWTAPAQDRRIVVAVTGSLAIAGNDESVVRACLDAKKGARPNLSTNPSLQDMRQRMNGGGALAFGYVSPAGAARLFDVYAALYAGQITDDPGRQELAAGLLSEVAKKTFGAIGWSARFADGRIEDRYYLSLDPAASGRLAPTLAANPNFTNPEGGLLPPRTYSLTHYNLTDPLGAWNGLNGALAARLDAVLAAAVPVASARLLETYGIEDPGTFLSATGGQLITARLDDQPGSTVTLVIVKDQAVIGAAVQKRMGPNAKTEKVGDVEMVISADPKRGAAAFAGEVLLLGKPENIRRCLEARAATQTITSADGYTRALGGVDRTTPPVSYTLTNDTAAARDLILAVAARRLLRERDPDAAQLTAALAKLPYILTETRLVEGGFERKTRSAFGQFGAIAVQFAPAGK